jgi:Tol biopolymer transport system component/DNA-binding winged helix-turn-helix (wHTH) protein
MPENQGQHILRFGPFEADLLTQELRKHGVRLRLPGQAFQVLRMLLERPGELVTREKLRAVLWPSDTFVDFEHGLNASVNRLRNALGDSADSPQLIETLPRRGYRFIGELRSSTPAPVAPRAFESETSLKHESLRLETNRAGRRSGLTLGLWILAIITCMLGAAFIASRRGARPAPVVLNPLPFTTYKGTETMPTFSPDGSQIAFAWNGDPPVDKKGWDLYAKVVGSENLLRLTRQPSHDWIGSAWSPDGSQIAFHRIAGPDTGVYVVSALGGSERKLRSTRMIYYTPIDWSPDGKWIVFQDNLPPENAPRLYLLSPETLESHQIPHVTQCLAEEAPAFSHDGKQLAYTCPTNPEAFQSNIFIVPISGGQPKEITTAEPLAGWGLMMGLAWTADDKKLVFPAKLDSKGTGWQLYELTIADGSINRLPTEQSTIWPRISRKGDRLAYAAYSYRTDIWRKDLLHPESPAVELISSTREQSKPAYSPDGKHIVFESTRGGFNEIWMSDADGGELVNISNFKNSAAGAPNWSPDGNKVAFHGVSKQTGGSEIYVVDISERVARKLTTNISEAEMPSWSHDGKWIYFVSHENAGWNVYRCPATGGEALRLATLPRSEWGLYPTESFDGETLYLASSNAKPSLYAVDLKKPGTTPVVENLPGIQKGSLWTITPEGIYFVPADAPKSISYFSRQTNRVRKIFESDQRLWDGLSVSPDGRWLLYTQVDEENQDIMLVDHFR